jgi:hypothetical protein
MNETAAIVGIYGAVDEKVREDATARARVAQLLPQYGEDPEFSWYPEFLDWLDEKRTVAASERFPGIEDALLSLQGFMPKCRMRPRRLFAIAVATRAFPEMLESGTDLGEAALKALTVKNIAEQEGNASDLLHLLADETRLDGVGGPPSSLAVWWGSLVDTAVRRRLISDAIGMRPRPCSGKLVDVPGAKGPAAAFVTEFETDEVDYEHAIRYLQPASWKECMPDFWCEMKSLGAPNVGAVYRFHEVVSSDCADQKGAYFRSETDLDFTFLALEEKGAPVAAVANYQLSKGRPAPGDLIEIDEGSLVVAKASAEQRPLRITTTKRILFDRRFDSRALALIMCSTGYADVAADLLCCAARTVELDKKGKKIGKAFSGVAPPRPRAPQREAPRAARRAAPGASPRPDAPGTLAEMAQSTVDVWIRLLRGSAKALEMGASDIEQEARKRPRDRSED